MLKDNAFGKKYVTGRKDQFDINHTIFSEAVKSTKDREALTIRMEEKFNFMISHTAEDNANILKQEMELL